MNTDLPSVREICKPRDDVLSGKSALDIYAASLSQVVSGKAPEVYLDTSMFFENTYPTEGIKTTVREVFTRLTKKGSGSPVIKLETSLGGGKTHTLIALYHLAKNGSKDVPKKITGDLNIKPVKVAAIVGTEVSTIPSKKRPSTIWGEIAVQLRGKEGYNIIKAEDLAQVAPGERKLREMFGSDKCLILIDEIAIYLAKASAIKVKNSTLAEQTIVFLQELTQVASSLDSLGVVITSLDKRTVFAHRTEEINRILDQDVVEAKASEAIYDADKVLSRIVQNLTPTKGEEFPAIVRHRLFKNINRTAAIEVCKAYHNSLNSEGVKDYVPKHSTETKYMTFFQEAYPFHPELIQILRTKTSSISDFNQTRGVLRLLSVLVHNIWKKKIDTPIIHPYHIDFKESKFTDELISRLDRGEFMAAVTADIADKRGTPRSALVDDNYSEPYGTMVSTVIFLHSLTGIMGADIRRGANEAEIQLSMHRPGIDPKTIENAIKDFEDTAFYMEKQGSMYAFKSEPTLNKIIEEAKVGVEGTHVLSEIEKRIEQIYGGRRLFEPKLFANEPSKVPDDTGKPKLVIPHFNESVTSGGATKIPEIVDRIYHETGTLRKPRVFSNNLVFLVVDRDEKESMDVKAREYLALKKLCDDIEEGAPGLQALSKAQRDKLKEKREKAELFLKVAIIAAYKHLYIPTAQKSLEDTKGKKPLRKISIRMSDTEIENQVRRNQSEEEYLINFLKNNDAARTADDDPWAPEFILDRLWPKNSNELTGDEFKKLFFKNPDADLIFSENLIIRAQQAGVKEAKWIGILGNQFYDKPNSATFTGAFSPELHLILTDTDEGHLAWQQFNCPKCKNRLTSCICGEKQCPRCGKPTNECSCQEPTCNICGKALDVCGGIHVGGETLEPISDKTMAGIIGELEPLLTDSKVANIKNLNIKAKGRDDLAKLVLALPQFHGSEISFDTKAALNKKHMNGNLLEITYEGDQKGFNSIKSVLLNYNPKEQFSSCSLNITFAWKEGITKDNLIELLRDKIAQFTGDSIYSIEVTPKTDIGSEGD